MNAFRNWHQSLGGFDTSTCQECKTRLQVQVRPILVEQKEELAYCMLIKGEKELNGKGEWYLDILQYLKEGTYPKSVNKDDQLTIWRLSTNYIIYGESLYKRSCEGMYLLCVTTKEA